MVVQTQTVFTDPHNASPQAYLVRPDDDAVYPGVVLIQEWWGLEPHIRELAQRLASEGFVVLVPDLYHGKIATEPDECQRMLMMTFNNIETAINEIILSLNYLRNNAGVQPKRIGLMGFCMGGHLAFRAAERYPHLGALSPWYAGGYDPSADDVARVNAPVLAVYGENDGGIPIPQVRKIEQLYREADKQIEVLVYPNVGHAFNNPDHGMGNAEAAKDAWARAVAFFKDKLK